MAEGSTFRGYKAIGEALERIDTLALWVRQFKPAQERLTLLRNDYDLIRRWPKAAHVHQIEVVDGRVWYHGLECFPDTGPGRYQKPEVPQQTDIEDVTHG